MQRKITFVIVVLVAIVVTGIIVAWRFFHQQPEENFNFSDYVAQYRIQLPADLTEQHQKVLFGKAPKQLHPAIAQKLVELYNVAQSYHQTRLKLIELANSRDTASLWNSTPLGGSSYGGYNPSDEFMLALWFTRIVLSGDGDGFQGDGIAYPDIYDPKRESDYWAESTAEWLELLDSHIAFLHESQAFEHAEIERLSILERRIRYDDLASFRDRYINIRRYGITLSRAQQQRLCAGDPLFRNPKIDRILYHDTFWDRFYSNPLQKPLLEKRDAELAPLKIDETPELDTLELTAEDIVHWDGSTSLIPLAKIIAAHVGGCPWKWNVFYEINGNRVSQVVLTESYYVLFDDEQGGEYNRHLVRNRQNDPEFDAGRGKPPANLINELRFSQTHDSIVHLINGKRDLVFSTRRPSPDEITLAREKGIELVCTPFARDAFVFLRNRHNPVRDLSLEQVRGIFSGKYVNWKDVGGFAGKINPLIRDRNSGSEELMRELVMNNTPVPDHFNHQLIGSMAGIFDHLDHDLNGIGYSIMYYERNMICSPYVQTFCINGVEPNPATVASGGYPLTYECMAIHRKAPGQTIERFVTWLTGEEGQQIVRESGYVPIAFCPMPQTIAGKSSAARE